MPNCRLQYRAMYLASAHGLLPLVEWLHGNQPGGCTKRVLDQAAGNGHRPVWDGYVVAIEAAPKRPWAAGPFE